MHHPNLAAQVRLQYHLITISLHDVKFVLPWKNVNGLFAFGYWCDTTILRMLPRLRLCLGCCEIWDSGVTDMTSNSVATISPCGMMNVVIHLWYNAVIRINKTGPCCWHALKNEKKTRTQVIWMKGCYIYLLMSLRNWSWSITDLQVELGRGKARQERWKLEE